MTYNKKEKNTSLMCYRVVKDTSSKRTLIRLLISCLWLLLLILLLWLPIHLMRLLVLWRHGLLTELWGLLLVWLRLLLILEGLLRLLGRCREVEQRRHLLRLMIKVPWHRLGGSKGSHRRRVVKNALIVQEITSRHHRLSAVMRTWGWWWSISR